MDIKSLIGETTDYDKKESVETKEPQSWLKSVSAFANGTGGSLIFGITNNDEVVGLNDPEGNSEDISEIIKNRIDPHPRFNLRFETIDSKILIILDVYPGDDVPYFYAYKGTRIAYLRIGNESIPASSTEIRRMSIKALGETYDSLVSRFQFEDMTFNKLQLQFKKNKDIVFEDTDFVSFGLVNHEGKLTNAGALLADDSPVRHSRVFCTRWNGLDKAGGLIDALDDDEFSGDLITLLQESLHFVTRNYKKPWMKAPDRRIEMPDYPERAVQEGIVNGLIHRDYTQLGGEVHIDMYDDRIEIVSPGGMFDGSLVQNLNPRNVTSLRRNPILADIFSRLGYMERRGSGFKKILDAYEFHPNYKDEYKPEFRSTASAFWLTLKNLNYNVLQDVPQGVLQDVPQGVQLDKIIIDAIESNNRITRAEIAKIAGVSEKTIGRKLSKMNNIHYIGRGYSGHWEIDE